MRRPKRQQRFPEWLSLRQQLFVVAYVGPALGNGAKAHKMVSSDAGKGDG